LPNRSFCIVLLMAVSLSDYVRRVVHLLKPNAAMSGAL